MSGDDLGDDVFIVRGQFGCLMLLAFMLVAFGAGWFFAAAFR